MGTSKISLLSCVYVILGLYTFAFNNSEETTSKLAYTAGNQTQAEQLAKAGLSLGLLKLYNYSPSTNYNNTYFSTQNGSTMGGTVTYKASVQLGLSSDERQVVATGTIGTTTVTVTAIVHYVSGRWSIERTYLQ